MIFDIDTARLLLGIVWQQLWIGSLLVLLVSVGLRLFKSLNAATRYWIWLLTLITLAMLPLPILFPASPATSVAENLEQPSTYAGSAVVDAAPSFAASEELQPRRRASEVAIGHALVHPGVSRGLASSLAVGWLCGTLWMLLTLLRGARIASRLQRESRPAPLPQAPADIRLSNLARTPMVVGLRRPTILIPAALFEQVSREELQRILEHELAHVRRHDQWLMLVQKLIEALYFFHPAVRYAAVRLDDEREISCDDRAAHDQRKHYAGSLIRICKSIVQPQPEALSVGAVRSRNQLTRRIACLMDARRNHTADVSRTSLAMSMLMLVAAMTVAFEFMPRIAIAEATQDEHARSGQHEFGTPLIAASMMEAAARGEVVLLKRLKAAGGDVNQVNPGDGTPLIAAARRGSLAAAKWLLENGSDVNLPSKGDGNPLIMAAAHGHTEIVRLLLDHDADIDAVVPGDETALISSSRSGAIEAVRLLLERGADVNIEVPEGGGIFGEPELRTALNQATKAGHGEIAALLVAHGASR